MMPRTVSTTRGRACAAAILVVLVGAPTARAQTADPEARPTRGVHLAGAARAGDADATAVQENPAQLGLLPAGGLAVAAERWDASTQLPGRGAGVFMATPAGLLHGGLGFGLSHVGDTPTFGVESHTTMQVAYALRLGRALSLGASWVHVWGGRFGGTDTFDLAASARGGRHLALGLVVEDVGAPSPAASAPALPRLWAGELVLRPLGTSRLELAVGASHVEGELWRWIVPRARLAATIADGLRIFATGATLPRGGAYAFAHGADYQAELGVALDFDHLGLTAGARAGFPGPGGGGDGGGAALLLRAEGERRPPLVAPAVVVRLDLEHISSDAAFVELVRRVHAPRARGRSRACVAVLLHVDELPLGLGRIEELRDLVATLRARGKRVYAYGSFPSTRDYYLATACDAIVIHPAGTLSLTGFSRTVTFYKRLPWTPLGVNVDLVRIGEFKGAMEPFVFNEQSAPVRANKNDLLDDIYRRLVADSRCAARRAAAACSTQARVRVLVDRGPLPRRTRRSSSGSSTPSRPTTSWRPTCALSLEASVDHDPASPTRRPRRGGVAVRRHVAVVLVDGTIVDGKSHRFPVRRGAHGRRHARRRARGVPPRRGRSPPSSCAINSPGGSAFASDVASRAPSSSCAAPEQARRRLDGRHRRLGRLLHRGPRRRDLRRAVDAERLDPASSATRSDVRKLLWRRWAWASRPTAAASTRTTRSPLTRPWTDGEIKIAAEKIR